MNTNRLNQAFHQLFETDRDLIPDEVPAIQHEIDAEKEIRELTIERKSEQEINRQRSQ